MVIFIFSIFVQRLHWDYNFRGFSRHQRYKKIAKCVFKYDSVNLKKSVLNHLRLLSIKLCALTYLVARLTTKNEAVPFISRNRRQFYRDIKKIRYRVERVIFTTEYSNPSFKGRIHRLNIKLFQIKNKIYTIHSKTKLVQEIALMCAEHTEQQEIIVKS